LATELADTSSTELGPAMELLNGIALSAQAKLGVGDGAAQAIAWFSVLMVVYIVVQVLKGVIGGAMSKKRTKRGNNLLFLGQCGAGKTTLFFRLRDREEKQVTTVSSLKMIRDSFQIKMGDEGATIGPLEVVDCPGHLRLRGKSTDLVPEARCIVYLVDSEDKPRLKDVAEHLYELFTNQEVMSLGIPILLALNKIDLPSARTEKFIMEELEREIEQMRVSRGATLDGQDAVDSYLGVDGEKFRLREHAPCPLEICRISVSKSDLDPFYDFLGSQFGLN